MTAYEVSTDTGELAGMARVLTYPSRNLMPAVPRPRAHNHRGDRARAKEHPRIRHEIAGEAVHFPDQPHTAPVPVRQGQREFTHATKANHHIRIHWRCSCGRTGGLEAATWRRWAGNACRACAKPRKFSGNVVAFGKMASSHAIMPTAKMQRGATGRW